MRVVQHPQMNIGEVDVSRIVFDARSRDDIPKILRGLQHLYTDTTLRTAVFELLTSQIAPKVSKDKQQRGKEQRGSGLASCPPFS